MRNLLALIGLVVIGFAAIGWYCGWYTLSVSKGGQGKPEIKTTLDTDKVTNDSSAFFQRMKQLVSEKAAADEKKSPSNPPEPGTNEKGDAKQGGWLFAPSRPATSPGTSNR